MPIARSLLPWNAAPLQSAATRLLDEAPRGELGVLDLRATLVVLPGARAARRLLEMLVDGAAQRALRLAPPRFTTPGRVALELYETPSAPTAASALEAEIAWLEALRSAGAGVLEDALGLRGPRSGVELEGPAGWSLARELERARADLHAEGIDAAQISERIELEPVAATWRAIAEIEQEAERRLAVAQRRWPERLQREAVERGLLRADFERVVAIAVVEWHALARAALERARLPVEIWVHARAGELAHFDDLGRPRTEVWAERAIELEDAFLLAADQPADQAAAVVGALHAAAPRAAVDEIAIGVLDPALVPFLAAEFAGHDIEAHDAAGTSVAHGAPHTLLAALASWRATRSFAALARLARHPDAALALSGNASGAEPRDIAAELDRHWRAHLQTERGSGGWLANAAGEPSLASEALERASAALERVLAPLEEGERPLGAWAAALRAVAIEIYGASEAPSHEARASLLRLGEALESLAALPAELAPLVTGVEALARWLDLAATLPPIPPPPRDRALDLLGALELHLDDAPVLVLAGLNEGRFPSTRHADRLLPDGLLRKLGLPGARERSARDTYLLAAMIAPRRAWRAVYGRRSAEDDALLPSRLLFRAPAAERGERVEGLLERAPYARPPGVGSRGPSGLGGELVVPRPQPLDASQKRRLELLPVSAFRAYLACPYRFYLSYVLGLAALDDRSVEMDARLFGNLAHDVLQSFGESEVRSSRDAEEVREWLSGALDARARERFGASPLVAVQVQIEMLRRRLERFATWQAAWAREGWRIVAVEREAQGEIERPEGRVRFRGRMDRIDARGDELCVFDYKTGDKAVGAEAAHGSEVGERWAWSDLQLPLYRVFARDLAASEGLRGGIRLAYLHLPRRLDQCGANFAAWDEATLATAEAEAVRIAAAIRAERFWPPNPDVPLAHDDYAAICQRRSILLSLEDENAGEAGEADEEAGS